MKQQTKDWEANPNIPQPPVITPNEPCLPTPILQLRLQFKNLINPSSHHIFAWCVSCANVLFIQCDAVADLPYMSNGKGSIDRCEPKSVMVAVSCRFCFGVTFQKVSSEMFTTLSLSPEWVVSTFLYQNLGKITCRPVTIPHRGKQIIAVPIDKLAKDLKFSNGPCRVLGLKTTAAHQADTSMEDLIAPFVSSNFI
jgi:hypothetical protein